MLKNQLEFGAEIVLVFTTQAVWENKRIIDALEKTIQASGLNVMQRVFHVFQPQGLTHAWILSESHCVVSTWPEKNTAIVNLFVCSKDFDSGLFVRTLQLEISDLIFISMDKVFEL